MLRAELRGTSLLCRLAAHSGPPTCIAAPSRSISQLPFFVGATAFPLPSPQKWHRAGVALCGAARDEMTPGAGVRSLLNRPPLGCERLLEDPGFDSLAERQLL